MYLSFSFSFSFLYIHTRRHTHTRVNMAAWKALLIIIAYICLVIEGSKSNCFCLVGIYGFGYRSGVVDEQGKAGMGQFIQTKKLESWEDQMLGQAPNASLVDVKQENLVNSYAYGHGSEELQSSKPSWSPKSCVTTSFSSNMLDFSNNKTDGRHPPPDLSSEVRKRSDFIALSIKVPS